MSLNNAQYISFYLTFVRRPNPRRCLIIYGRLNKATANAESVSFIKEDLNVVFKFVSALLLRAVFRSEIGQNR